MDLLGDKRVVIGGGVVLALLAGLGLALLIGGDKGPKGPPPASQAGLVVNIGRDDDFKTKTTLRCFVNGQFAGLLTLTDCAQRNGVATTALDVGIDATGALAAAETLGATLAPLPPSAEPAAAAPATVAPVVPVAPAASDPAPRAAVAGCQRYDRGWTKIGDMSLNGCVQALFAGRCERAGAATYGRWGDQTLRLVTGRVELSADDRSFRTLAEQGPNCSVPGF